MQYYPSSTSFLTFAYGYYDPTFFLKAAGFEPRIVELWVQESYRFRHLFFLRLFPQIWGLMPISWLPDCTGRATIILIMMTAFFPRRKPMIFQYIILHLSHSYTNFDLDHYCSTEVENFFPYSQSATLSNSNMAPEERKSRDRGSGGSTKWWGYFYSWRKVYLPWNISPGRDIFVLHLPHFPYSQLATIFTFKYSGGIFPRTGEIFPLHFPKFSYIYLLTVGNRSYLQI